MLLCFLCQRSLDYLSSGLRLGWLLALSRKLSPSACEVLDSVPAHSTFHGWGLFTFQCKTKSSPSALMWVYRAVTSRLKLLVTVLGENTTHVGFACFLAHASQIQTRMKAEFFNGGGSSLLEHSVVGDSSFFVS